MSERIMVMRVTIRRGVSKSGDVVVAHSSERDWSAIWRGTDGVMSGDTVDVEIEAPEPVPWNDVTVTDVGSAGIWESNGDTVVCGHIDRIFDDGLVALNLQPGIILIDMDGLKSTLQEGEFARFPLKEISIYPTGI